MEPVPEPETSENALMTDQNAESVQSGQGQLQIEGQGQGQLEFQIGVTITRYGLYPYVDYKNRNCLITVLILSFMITTTYFGFTWAFEPFFELTYIYSRPVRNFARGYIWFMAGCCVLGFLTNCYLAFAFNKLALNVCPLTAWMWIFSACLVFNIPEMILIIIGLIKSQKVNEGRLLLNPRDEDHSFTVLSTQIGLGAIVVFMVSHCLFGWVAWSTRKTLIRIRAQISPEITHLETLFRQFGYVYGMGMGGYGQGVAGYGMGRGGYGAGYGMGFGGYGVMSPPPGPPGGAGSEYYNYSNAYPPMAPAEQ